MKLKFHRTQDLRCAVCGRSRPVMVSYRSTRCGCVVTVCLRRSCKRAALNRRHYSI